MKHAAKKLPSRNTSVARKVMKVSLRIVIVLCLLVTTIGVAGAAIFVRGVDNADIPDSPENFKARSAITFMADDGKTVLGTIQPPEGVRSIVPSEHISQNMKNALISAEDETFNTNYGFAPLRILRAAYGHAIGESGAGGGSTITQQLVKNTLVGDEVSIDRKWKEILSSSKLTASWSKDDIISAYLNTVYFGRGALGIEKAAQAYFGVHASQLDESQSALLAGIIQSPSQHDPAVNKESAEYRFNYVKKQMKDNDMVDNTTYSKMSFPQTIEPKPLDPSTGLTDSTGHIISQALAELDAEGISRDDLFDDGATVTTTISPRVQKVVVDSAHNTQNSTGLTASVSSIDNATGAIKGIYGGDDGLGYDRSIAQQMTGSTFKIFTLAAALDSSAVGLNTPVSSDPYVIGNHTVNNSDGMGGGMQTVAEATKQSLNTSFYRIVDKLPNGPASVRDMARKLGVNAPLSESDGSVNHSITLGTYGTSVEQMSHGLSSIINGGTRYNRHIVSEVKNRNDQSIYKVNLGGKRVISEATANDVKSALAPIADYSNGNGIGKPSYSKSGTTEHPVVEGMNKDGLYVGGSDTLTTAVHLDKGGEPVVLWGAQAPASLWSSIMRQVG